MSKDHTLGLRRWQVSDWRGVVHIRSAAREPFPPPALGPIKVWYRDIALDARGVGNSVGGYLFVELDGPAISGFTTQPQDYRRQQQLTRESPLDQRCSRLDLFFDTANMNGWYSYGWYS